MKTNSAKLMIQQGLVLNNCFHLCDMLLMGVFIISRLWSENGPTNEKALSKDMTARSI